MALHPAKDIESAANALANQLAAGIPIKEAVGRMSKLQPKFQDLWTNAADSLSRGGRLSGQLEGVWPEAIVAALKAGEEAGKTEEVLKRTAQSLRVKQDIKKIYSKLLSPAFAFLAGLGVCLFFMISVIPMLASSLGTTDTPSLMLRLSLAVSSFLKTYWIAVLIAAGISIAGFIQWARQPSSLDIVIARANQLPVLGPALRSLFFGMWAYQIALMDSAGLPVKQQLTLSLKTLPLCYREGVEKMAAEVEKRGIADSADPDKQEEGDPRKEWPFYISTAFITSHETGRTDQEMQRCAPILIEEGLKDLNRAISVADLIAKLLASLMISVPLMGYFSQMADSMTAAFK